MSTPTEPNMQIIENASSKDVRPGDHIIWEDTWERHGVTRTVRREGIAAHQSPTGDWYTADGMNVTSGEGEGITITIRRPDPELPTTPRTVIVPADGHEYIEATHMGQTYHAREAVLIGWGLWQGAWSADGDVQYYMTPSNITPGTWKVGNR